MVLRGGRYEILGTIAAGGMASVHLGRAVGAGGFERLVAIKTMHPHLAGEAEFVAMFFDEARLAARIHHPNVVATLDIQRDSDGLFLVMEYVEGPSLSRMLRALSKSQTKVPLDIALRIFADALSGLHAAHELTGADGESLRLVHRDMSPHNVLVGADGVTRLTDFGVARADSRLATTRNGSVKGKVSYMAPEQVRALPIDRRADIYAAGVVLWEMLTGERFVRADSEVAAMHQILRSKRRTPMEVDKAVPEAISAVCMHALERDRERRFSTAAAFGEALENAAAECGVSFAAPRAVSQFLREHGLHQVPVEPPPPSTNVPVSVRTFGPGVDAPASVDAAPSVGDASKPAAGVSVSEAASATASRLASTNPLAAPLAPEPPVSLPSGQRISLPSGSLRFSHATVTGQTAAEEPPSVSTAATFSAEPTSKAPPRQSRLGFVLAIVAATVLGAALATVWVTRAGTAAPDGATMAVAPPPPASTPAAPSVVPAPLAAEPTSTASAQPTSSAAATSSASTNATATASVMGKGPVPAPANARPQGTTPKGFRPKEL